MTKTYSVEIASVSPMLHHSSAGLGQDEPSVKMKRGGDALVGDKDDWKKTVYFHPSVGVFLPAMNVEAAIIEAAKQFKIGRGNASKYFKSGFFIEEDMLPFLVKGQTIKDVEACEVDTRTVRNPATKGRNVRRRAIFREWSSKFSIIVSSDEYITEELLRSVFEYAGLYIGVGDYRPRFGRFHVVKLKEAV